MILRLLITTHRKEYKPLYQFKFKNSLDIHYLYVGIHFQHFLLLSEIKQMAEITTITIDVTDLPKKMQELKKEGCYQFIIELSDISDTCQIICTSDDTGSIRPDIRN